ncbi:type II toxin-antitoxin system HicA family toxin [Ilumatobacter fluminis]|uniref:type II toxin-antitoxin system HicA family toxin n=1 Tax=Ilumatobacter fluminis TaxID=467091 RepID=UPI0032EB7A34
MPGQAQSSGGKPFQADRDDVDCIRRRSLRSMAPGLTGRRLDLVRTLEAEGYVAGGGKGSHQKFTRPGRPMIVVPYRRSVSPGVLRSTARALGVSIPELMERLRGGR